MAGGAASAEVFNAIAREVAQLLDRTLVNLWRYERDGTATVLGAWSERPHPFQPGTNWPFETPSAAAGIGQTKVGRPVRVDDIAKIEGVVADALREIGMRAAAVAPIVVGGEVWGMIGTASADRAPLPDGIEDRLAEFTELFGTTIANAESRAGLARLAEEQAALRRVATLVAHEAPQAEIFAAIAEEIGRLLGADYIRMVRFEDDRLAVVVASAGATEDALPGRLARCAGGRQCGLARLPDAAAGTDRRLPHGERPDRAEHAIDGDSRGRGHADTGGRPALGRDGRGDDSGAAAAAGDRVSARPVHRVDGHGDRQHRGARGGGAARERAGRAAAGGDARRQGAPPAELFAKVVEELANVFGEVECLLFRDEGDATATVVASCGAGCPPPSRSAPAYRRTATASSATVLREGRPHRVDDYSTVSRDHRPARP